MDALGGQYRNVVLVTGASLGCGIVVPPSKPNK
jgi:hypothetical protein